MGGIILGNIVDFLVKNNVTVFYSVSGGMDSVVASTIAHDFLKDYDVKKYCVYAHTPLALEVNKKYVKRFCEWLGVELVVVEPEEGKGLEGMVKYGFPSFNRRWCMWRWKIDPMQKMKRNYLEPHLFVVGVRKKESKRRGKLYGNREEFYYDKKHKRYVWLPVLDWDKKQVMRYIEEKGIPKSSLWSSNGHSSSDCVVCIAYATKRDYLRLKNNYPEIWEKLLFYYHQMNKNRKREKKIIASNFVDLDFLHDTSLQSFIKR